MPPSAPAWSNELSTWACSALAAAGTGEAKDALRFLGIQLRDSSGKMRPMEGLLEDVADALAKIEDPLLRNRIAFKLFDSEGVDVGRMLAAGSEALRQYGDEAERLGVITEEDARAAEGYRDSLTAMRRAVSFLGHEIGRALMPRLLPLVDGLRDLSVSARPRVIELLRSALADLDAVVAAVRDGWVGLGQALQAGMAWIREVAPPIARWIEAAGAWIDRIGVVRVAVGLLAAALGIRLIGAILSLFVPLARLAASLVVVAVRMMALSARAIVALIGGIGSMLGALGRAAAGVLALNAAFLASPITWIVAGVAAVAGAAYLIYRYWDDIAAFFRRTWEAIVAALGIEELIAWLGGFSLWGTFTGWLAGVVDWYARSWEAIVAALGIEELIAWLGGFSLWDTFTGWLAGVVDWYARSWEAIVAALGIEELIARLGGFSLWGTLTDWLGNAVAWYGRQWAAIEGVFDLEGLIARLSAWNFGDIGQGWINGLWGGMAGVWRGLVDWLNQAVAGIVDLLPGFIKDRLGIAGLEGMLGVPDGAPATSPAKARSRGSVPSIIGPQSRVLFGAPPAGADRPERAVAVGGQVDVRFHDAPTNMRIERVATRNREIPIDVTAGYSMAGAG